MKSIRLEKFDSEKYNYKNIHILIKEISENADASKSKLIITGNLKLPRDKEFSEFRLIYENNFHNDIKAYLDLRYKNKEGQTVLEYHTMGKPHKYGTLYNAEEVIKDIIEVSKNQIESLWDILKDNDNLRVLIDGSHLYEN